MQLRHISPILILVVGLVGRSPAQTLQYSGANTGAAATGQGGTGNWDLSTANWYNGSTGVVWDNASTASFGGTTGGTVTLNTSVSAAGLTFGITGYTVAGSGTLTLSGSPTIASTASGSSTQTINEQVSATGLVTLASAAGATSATFNFGAPSLSNTTPAQSTANNSFAGGILVQGSNIRLNFNSPGASGTGSGAGTIQVAAAATRITNAGSLPAFAATISNNIQLNSTNQSGTFQTAMGATTPSGTVTSLATTTVLTYTGVISGASDVIVSNSTTAAGGGAGVTVFGNSMTYTGATIMNASATAVFRMGVNNALPTGSQLAFGQTGSTQNVGIVDMNGFNLSVGSLQTNTTFATSATNGPGITNSGDTGGAGVKTLTLTGTGTATYSNIIGTLTNTSWFTGAGAPQNPGGTNNISLVVNNSGLTQILSGNNTYNGGTTVTAGTLLINGQTGANSGTGTGAVTINGGLLGGTGRIAGAVTVNSGGALQAGQTAAQGGTTATATGTLTLGGNAAVSAGGAIQASLAASGTNSTLALGANSLNLSGTSQLKLSAVTGFSRAAAGTYTLATLTGSLQLDGATTTSGQVFGSYVQGGATNGVSILPDSTLALTTGDSLSLQNSGGNLVLVFTPVPEPATVLAVAAAGLGGVRLVRRRLTASSRRPV